MMWWDHGGGWGWGDWLAMTALMGVLWAAVAVAVLAVLRGAPWADRGRSGRAADVLAERFARGELDEDEYRHRLSVLRGDAGSTAAGRNRSAGR